MAAGRRRIWFGRIAGLTLVLVVAFLAFNWSDVRAKYAAHQLRSATTEDERTQHAKTMLALGEAGFAQVIEVLRSGDAPTCEAIAKELRESVANPAVSIPLLTAMPEFGEAGREAVLAVLPEMLKSKDEAVIEKCRAAVECGLQSSTRAKVQAAKMSGRPPLRLTAAVLPLLSDPDAEVRAAALTAVGTAGDAAPIGDEDLFRWMNDPDANVRSVCEAVLESRGRTADEIDLGRRLTHPQARERLQLLVDLAHEPSRDIGPWLERLGRDAEPAVRAAAVRVASERKLMFAEWADELARNDPDATVRQVATFHRRKAAGLIEPAGYKK